MENEIYNIVVHSATLTTVTGIIFIALICCAGLIAKFFKWSTQDKTKVKK